MDGPPSTTTPTPPLAPPNDDAVSISTNCKDMHRSDSKTGLVWRSGAFAGQFGDNFIQDTDLEGGQVAPSIEYLASICKNILLTSRIPELTLFTKEEVQKVHLIVNDLQEAAERDRVLDTIRAKRGGSRLNNANYATLLENLITKLANLAPRQRIVISGGWAGEKGGHAIMHCVERENNGDYAIVTFNTGEGVEHHPSNSESYPKNKSKCAMRFTGITSERILDPNAWYLFFHIKVTNKKENVPAMIYDVFLPFLNDGAIGEAVDRDFDTSGWWETPQLAGTCYYRCILTTFRYLLKKDNFTQTQQKQLFVHIRASFLDKILLELNTELGQTNFRVSDQKMIDLGCSQTLNAAMKLSKREGIDSNGMLRLEKLVHAIADKCRSTPQVDALAVEMKPLGLESSAPLLPYPNFELIRAIGVSDPEIYAGGETSGTPDLFIDLTESATNIFTMTEYNKKLKLLNDRCISLRAKTSVCAATIALHQICSLVQRTFSVVLPFPPNRGQIPTTTTNCWWHTTALSLSNQRDSLLLLLQIMKVYVMASRSLDGDRYDDSIRTFTTSAIFCHFDALSRVLASTGADGTNDDKHGGRSPLSLCLSTGEYAGGENSFLINALQGETKTNLKMDSKDNVYRECNPIGVVGYPMASFGELTLETLSETMLIGDPRMATLRHSILQYIQSMPKEITIFGTNKKNGEAIQTKPVGGSNKQTVWQFQSNDKDEDPPTMKFVHELRISLGKEHELPPVDTSISFRKQHRRGRGQTIAANADATQPMEQKAKWLISNWDLVPEMKALRDMVFLFRISLEPYAALKAMNPSHPELWYEDNATPRFGIMQVDPRGKMVALEITLGENGIDYSKTVIPSPASISTLLPSSATTTTEEEDILHLEELPNFDNALSPEEAEAFLSYLTARHVAPPLVLAFFGGDRIGQLLNRRLQGIVESVLFEPLEYSNKNEFQNATSGHSLPRIPATHRSELGTMYGVAMTEATHTPDAILEPLLNVCRSAADKCIGDYRSSFVDLLCYVVRIAIRFVDMCRYLNVSTLKLIALEHFLTSTASPLLSMWASEAFRANSVAKEIQIHAHLALIHAPKTSTTEKTSKIEDVRTFSSSSSYVVTWHSKTEASESALQEGGETEKESKVATNPFAGNDMMMQMFGSMSGQKSSSEVTEIKSFRTPTRKVFDLIDLSRDSILRWFMVDAKPNELDSVLQSIVSVGQRREAAPCASDDNDINETNGTNDINEPNETNETNEPNETNETNNQDNEQKENHENKEQKQNKENKENKEKTQTKISLNEWHGWQPDNQKPLCCNQTIQSSHPYLPSTDSYQTVSFPGASKVSIFFDTNCATEEERDYVTIYRDETFTDFWGKKKKISGTDGWPGSGGRPPMVIPSDSFVVHFHSDASIQNWGFKLDAKAPVNLEKATQLLEKEKQEKQEKKTLEHTMLGLYACQRALAECLNDYEAAIVWMNENRTLLLQEEKEQQEEKRRLDENNGASSASSRGLYKDPVGSIRVNVQTSEIYLRDRMLMPVPSQMASHPTFLDIFGKGSEPFCAVVSSTEHRKWIQIMHKDHNYQIQGWQALRRTQGEGGRGAIVMTNTKGDPNNTNDEPQIGYSAFNLPVMKGVGGAAKVNWRGKDYLRYDRGSKGWISSIYDRALDTFVRECSQKGNSLDWPDVFYETGNSTFSGGCGSMLAFVEAEGDFEACKGHPGTWFDIRVIPPSFENNGRIEVYTLIEEGRLIQRTLCWSSDSRLSLYHLDINGDERKEPEPMETMWSAGNIYNGHYAAAPSGRLLPRAGAGARYNDDVYSLSITRSRIYKGWGGENAKKQSRKGMKVSRPDPDMYQETETETYVSKNHLYGLIPESLLDKYRFWKTGPYTLRGYKMDYSAAADCGRELMFTDDSLLIILKDVDSEKGVLRQNSTPSNDANEEANEDANEDANEAANDLLVDLNCSVVATVIRLKRGGEREYTLMNLDPASIVNNRTLGTSNKKRMNLKAVSTVSDYDKGMNVLTRLRNRLTRIDNLSHILLWTESNADITEYCEISKIECTRINAQFELKRGKLYSLDHDGLVLSDIPPKRVMEHLNGLQRSLVLENRDGEPFIMVPNYKLTPINIKSAPFSTQIVTGRSSELWSNHVQTQFYVYPVHPSGSYVQTESLASALYLVVIHLLNRDYKKAAPLISTCHTDMKFSKEERWIMSMHKRDDPKQYDKHPDAHACRLMLALVCIECGEAYETLLYIKDEFSLKDDYQSYIKKNAHVSQGKK